MKQFPKTFLLLLSLTVCQSARQNLNGKWTATGGDAGIILTSATVPGGIFSDLMNSGEIGDIFYGTGDTDYSWVDLSDWSYSKSFTVDEEFLSHSSINLVFEGLDTFATILINENEVGKSQNMFVRYVFNVKEYLHEGINELSVRFSSSVNVAAALAHNPNNKYIIPPECHQKEYNGVCHVNQIRKMQASFAWDWGPAFPSVGIWKDVYLENFNSATIDYVLVKPSRNPQKNAWNLDFTTYFGNGQNGAVQGTLRAVLEINNGTLNINQEVSETADEYGEIKVKLRWDVPGASVDTWWPNGYGAQTLYNLNVTFISGDEKSEKATRVGFREIRIEQNELEQGLSFSINVNGYSIFAKGANVIPINILPEKGQDHETVKKVLETAKDVNMNMLRVWGGGVYESDYFYDLADEFGILIWQDFMFACAMYPADSNYLSNVVEEVRHQVKRLGSHPSIAIWSGNNENEAALSQNWYNTSDNFSVYKNDYIKLYIDTIKEELSRIISNPNFVTSSPTNGAQSDQEGYISTNPYDPLYGDVHFYDYQSDSWSFSTFPIPRFASEYGYQSMPSIESWLTVTKNLEDLSPTSTFMKHRQHHPDGNQQNLDLINLQLQLPDVSSRNYTKAFIYFSQILQAQSVKIQTEHYRSFKGRFNEDKQGNTLGALYWQLNDVWVAPTWSGMDYTGRWKMLQYFSQDFFAPTIITGNINSTNYLEVFATSDLRNAPVNVTAAVMVYKWDTITAVPTTTRFPVTLDFEKSVLVAGIDALTPLKTAGCGSDYETAKINCFFALQLKDADRNDVAPTNYVFLEKFKKSNLSDASLEITRIWPRDNENIKFDIEVGTDKIALFVWLDTHEIKGRFTENGFLLTNFRKTVQFYADEPVNLAILSRVLTVTHLRDSVYL